MPAKQVSATGANYLRWLPDSSGSTYAFTNHLYKLRRTDAFASSKVTELKPSVEVVALTAPSDIPKGQIAIRNARIITIKNVGTMKGLGTRKGLGTTQRDVAIEKGDVVVKNNRIVALSPVGHVVIPRGARIIDATGKTVMPGILDIHAYLRAPGVRVSGQGPAVCGDPCLWRNNHPRPFYRQ